MLRRKFLTTVAGLIPGMSVAGSIGRANPGEGKLFVPFDEGMWSITPALPSVTSVFSGLPAGSYRVSWNRRDADGSCRPTEAVLRPDADGVIVIKA